MFLFLVLFLFSMILLASIVLVEQLSWYIGLKEWRKPLDCLSDPDTGYGSAALVVSSISFIGSLLGLSIHIIDMIL